MDMKLASYLLCSMGTNNWTEIFFVLRPDCLMDTNSGFLKSMQNGYEIAFLVPMKEKLPWLNVGYEPSFVSVVLLTIPTGHNDLEMNIHPPNYKYLHI